MKKILTALLILATSPAFATTYYANGLTSQNINYTTAGAGWYPVQGASCVATGIPVAVGSFANGDVLNANGCTALAVNVDPGGASVEVTLTTDTTNGGGFTYATATNITIHANITATKTTALTITGGTGGGTINGNITGGTVVSQYGVNDGHTLVTMNVIGNLQGGSGARGYYASGSTGTVIITGNSTGGSTSNTDGLIATGVGTITINGNCIGGSAANATNTGCYGSDGAITVTGNIINSIGAPGATGKIYFTPSATNYVLVAKDASYTTGVIDSHATEMPTNPGANNVASGIQYGSFTGTLSGGSVACATSNW